jgi:DNA-binding transcriptional ArsR family regulator
MEYRLYREFFRALANRSRFSMIELLRGGPSSVGDIAERLGYEQSRVSHNLACLLNCGFVEWEWRGKNKIYRLNPEVVPILQGIEKHLRQYGCALENCGVLGSEAQPVVVVPRIGAAPSQLPRRRKRSKS